jgi:hypothetical protein
MTKKEHREYLRLEDRLTAIGECQEALQAEWDEIVERLRELDDLEVV